MDRGDRRSGEREPGERMAAERSADPPRAAGAGGRGTNAAGAGGLALAGLGFQFAASLVAFYYLGQWLDRRFGTAPAAVLTCVLAGSGLSFFAMYRQLMSAQRRADSARRARGGERTDAGP
jgi:F0F1-type ATP synthase assembly protein I